MKTVFSNSDLVHTFAQRSQSEGRTSSGGMFFRGDKIYSYGYHYLLGEFIDDETIIINNAGYSTSTGQHISMLISATRQYRQIFTKDAEISLVKYRILEASDKLKTARKPEIYISAIIRDFEVLTDHLKEFKKVNTLKGNEYKEIKKIYSALKKDEGKYLEKLKGIAKKAKEKADKEYKERLDKFFNYKIDYIYSSDLHKEDFLRVSQDGDYVETTQQVRIEKGDAINLYRLIKSGLNVSGQRIGNYRVNGINTHLMIGCHRINLNSVTTVGELLLSKS